MKKYFEVKSAEKGLEIVGTDETLDRDGDIIRALGVDTKNYEDNPVLLFGHRWSSLPIGKVGKVEKQNDKVIFKDVEFAKTDDGKNVEYLVKNGFLKTVSVGIIPKKVFFPQNDLDAMKEIDPSFVERNIDQLAKTRRVIWESELFELSIVPIPANPNAQIVMANKGIDSMCAFKVASITEEDDDILIEIPLEEEKGAVRFSDHRRYGKADINMRWDSRKAIMSLRKWASSDGSGEKDTIDWRKYRKGFAWYDAENFDNFEAYKLPHHIVEDGELKVVWRGVVAAMAALLGSRGGTDIPEGDKKGVYNHLAKHYDDFDKKPPKYKSYDLVDIKDLDEEHAIAMIEQADGADVVKMIKDLQSELTEMKKKNATNDDGADKQKGYNNNTKGAPSDTDADNSTGYEIEVDGLSVEELKSLMRSITIKTLKGEDDG